MTSNADKTCPVCGLKQEPESNVCSQCNWEFVILLGATEEISANLRQRLNEAQQAWQQTRYNPDLVPELQRDPFETAEEFAARLAERPWYVGDVELQKSGYDIATGYFPLRLIAPNGWVKQWLTDLDALSLCISRDPARNLYQQSAIWPLYAQLGVQNAQVLLDRLLLITHEGTLPVQSAPSVSKSEHREARSTLKSRYKDHGDGTLTDMKTGLQWMRCALGQTWTGNTCDGGAKKFTWQAAIDSVKRLNQGGGYAGHTDWRIPSISELSTLIYCSSGQPQTWNETGLPCKDDFERPTLDLMAFPNTAAGCFWSASSYDGHPDYAWYVQFNNGSVYYENKCYALCFRLVRIFFAQKIKN